MHICDLKVMEVVVDAAGADLGWLEPVLEGNLRKRGSGRRDGPSPTRRRELGGGRACLERIAGPDFNRRAHGRRFHRVRLVLVAAGVRAKAISGSKVDLREYELADLDRGLHGCVSGQAVRVLVACGGGGGEGGGGEGGGGEGGGGEGSGREERGGRESGERSQGGEGGARRASTVGVRVAQVTAQLRTRPEHRRKHRLEELGDAARTVRRESKGRAAKTDHHHGEDDAQQLRREELAEAEGGSRRGWLGRDRLILRTAKEEEYEYT